MYGQQRAGTGCSRLSISCAGSGSLPGYSVTLLCSTGNCWHLCAGLKLLVPDSQAWTFQCHWKSICPLEQPEALASAWSRVGMGDTEPSLASGSAAALSGVLELKQPNCAFHLTKSNLSFGSGLSSVWPFTFSFALWLQGRVGKTLWW